MDIDGAQVARHQHEGVEVGIGAVLLEALWVGKWACGAEWQSGRAGRCAASGCWDPLPRRRQERQAMRSTTHSTPPANPPHLQQRGLSHQEAWHEAQRSLHVTILKI